MKYIRGFLMAWGNFTAIPCPYKSWHEESRRAMLIMLPLIGLALGVVTALAWQLLELLGTSPVLTGVLTTAIYFLSTGFIHLDGFMDCSDAILSRRQDLGERQHILKDSAVGAFAVICVVLLFFVFASSLISIAEQNIKWKGIFLIGAMTLSRSAAAVAVLNCAPMKTSQYAAGGMTETKWVSKAAVAATLAAVVPLLLLYGAMLIVGLGQAYVDSVCIYLYIYAAAAAWAVAKVTGINDRRQLGGMSGDIAGHMITMGETAGVLAAALAAAWY